MNFIRSKNGYAFVFIFIISVIFVFDLFVHHGRPATFDGPTHIANMAQVYTGLSDGDFPVRWGSGWARYGWPAPLFAQQTTSYIGAFINFLTHDIVLSYNITILFGAFLSTYLLYLFLRYYVDFYAALLGATLFHFAPYRIINVYVRGAIPEFYASIFIITILISLYLALEKKKISGYFLLALSICMLLLTHLFMIVVGSIVFVPYSLFLLYKHKKNPIRPLIAIGIMSALGLGIAAYYVIPLFFEVKYLYYGGSALHYAAGNFLTLQRFINDSWPYFTQTEIGTRGHVLTGGMIEGISVISAAFWVIYQHFKNKSIQILPMIFIFVALVYCILMLPVSELLYQKIVVLGNVQHPWRMLTGYILIPPILLAFMIDKLPYKKILVIGILFIIAYLRFPQLYGKNYTQFPQKGYFITDDNLHGTILNTIWMGEVRDYPYQKEKVQIFEGAGKISNLEVRNSSRSYTIEAKTDAKVVDYTFYFPGWRAYVDNQEVPIQWQDPVYRGVITFDIPSGAHQIQVIFTDTKIRLLSKLISVISLSGLVGLFILRKRIFAQFRLD